ERRTGRCRAAAVRCRSGGSVLRWPRGARLPAHGAEPGVIDATATVPGSKSLTNRALVCAALARGTSTVTGALVADDTTAMTECLRALGVDIDWNGATVTVRGLDGHVDADSVTLHARLSGTTSRFVLPLPALAQ